MSLSHNQSENSASVSGSSRNGPNEKLDFAPSWLSTTAKKHQEAYEQALAYYIAVDMLPYSIVEKPGFQHFVKTCVPGFVIPSATTILINRTPKLYNQTLNVVKQELKKAKYIALTADKWQSIALISYLSLTAHFIDDDWKLKSVCLNCTQIKGNTTEKQVADMLSGFLAEWDLQKSCIVAVTTDASANIKKAIEIMDIPLLSCFEHSLNTGINNAFNAQSLQVIIDKIKKMASAMRLHPKRHDELIIHTQGFPRQIQKLPSHSKIGQWSLLTVIRKIVQNYTELCSLFKNSDFVPSPSEMSILKNVLEVLNPIEKISNQLRSETYISASYIIPLYEEVTEDFHDLEDESQIEAEKNIIAKEILPILEEQYVDYEMLKLCTVLDPRFKMTYINETQKQRLKDILYEEMDRIGNKAEVDIKKKIKTVTEFGEIFKKKNLQISNCHKLEVDKYLEIPEIDIEENVLDWWRLHSNTFSNLSKVARKYLCIQGIVASKRNLRTKGQSITEYNSGVSEKYDQQLMFLSINHKYVPK